MSVRVTFDGVGRGGRVPDPLEVATADGILVDPDEVAARVHAHVRGFLLSRHYEVEVYGLADDDAGAAHGHGVVLAGVRVVGRFTWVTA